MVHETVISFEVVLHFLIFMSKEQTYDADVLSKHALFVVFLEVDCTPLCSTRKISLLLGEADLRGPCYL